MSGTITRVTTERSGERNISWDHAEGCGAVPADYMPGQPFKSGRVCAGTGMADGRSVPSCQLCPHSPTSTAAAAPEPLVGLGWEQGTDDRVVPEHGGELDWTDRTRDELGQPRAFARDWKTGAAVVKPCVHCGGSTVLRNAANQPACKVCEERDGYAARIERAAGAGDRAQL